MNPEEEIIFLTPIRLFNFLKRYTKNKKEKIFFILNPANSSKSLWHLIEIKIQDDTFFIGFTKSERKISLCIWEREPEGLISDPVSICSVESGTWEGLPKPVFSKLDFSIRDEKFIEGENILFRYGSILKVLGRFLESEKVSV